MSEFMDTMVLPGLVVDESNPPFWNPIKMHWCIEITHLDRRLLPFCSEVVTSDVICLWRPLRTLLVFVTWEAEVVYIHKIAFENEACHAQWCLRTGLFHFRRFLNAIRSGDVFK
jgi:hypothetical protein